MCVCVCARHSRISNQKSNVICTYRTINGSINWGIKLAIRCEKINKIRIYVDAHKVAAAHLLMVVLTLCNEIDNSMLDAVRLTDVMSIFSTRFVLFLFYCYLPNGVFNLNFGSSVKYTTTSVIWIYTTKSSIFEWIDWIYNWQDIKCVGRFNQDEMKWDETLQLSG